MHNIPTPCRDKLIALDHFIAQLQVLARLAAIDTERISNIKSLHSIMLARMARRYCRRSKISLIFATRSFS